MSTTLKKINDFLAGLPMTIVAGIFLLLDLVPHLMEEFGGTPVQLSFLPFDPAWVTIFICGIPLLYLAIWRITYNRGVSKISSALLICIAMFAALSIGELFAAGGSRLYYGTGRIAGRCDHKPGEKRVEKADQSGSHPGPPYPGGEGRNDPRRRNPQRR